MSYDSRKFKTETWNCNGWRRCFSTAIDQSAASQEPPNGQTKDLLDSKLLYSRLESGIVILVQIGITFILKVEEKCWHTHFMLLLLFFSWFV